MKALLWISACLLALVGAAGAQHTAEDGTQRTAPWTKETLALASRLPVQDGGRVKPLSTYADFTLLRLNGKKSLETPSGEVIDATTWLLTRCLPPARPSTSPRPTTRSSPPWACASTARRRATATHDGVQPGIDRLYKLADEYHRIEDAERTTVQNQIVILAGNLTTFFSLAGQSSSRACPSRLRIRRSRSLGDKQNVLQRPRRASRRPPSREGSDPEPAPWPVLLKGGGMPPTRATPWPSFPVSSVEEQWTGTPRATSSTRVQRRPALPQHLRSCAS
jgi:hypothetical protein